LFHFQDSVALLSRKETILARVVEFDIFILSAYEVLEVKLVVLVFFSVVVAMWVVGGFDLFFRWFRFIGRFDVLRRLRDV
jgi:ribose/xylose/arabinose/galactoside ABC-type transport system permease subunit